MKIALAINSSPPPQLARSISLRSCAGTALLALALAALLPTSLPAAETGATFAAPEQAVAALSAAVITTNRAALASLFGSAVHQLVNPDEVQGAMELAEFAEAFNTANHLVRESETRAVIKVGANDWPFPIPLVMLTNGWHFDTEAGTEEILNRRIGRNELDVLIVMRAFTEAQREYASRDRDGDEVLEYAPKLNSAPQQTDGLYWATELNGEISPLGPLVAYAHGEGYSRKTATTAAGSQPFHGYYFKILTRQGKHAPGGKYNYVINGNMIGGFALVAWPAEYGESGIMTFIVNQQGRVYQKDLGGKTAKTATAMKEYNPDPTWTISRE
jgi:hypothetical protein